MLKIPLEDHIAGARAIGLLERETDPARRAMLLSAFAGLLRDHIQREDECLFEMFRQTLTPEQKLAYAKQAGEFDLANNTAGLLRVLSEI
jgi:hemerythrin-like domain-containing protein